VLLPPELDVELVLHPPEEVEEVELVAHPLEDVELVEVPTLFPPELDVELVLHPLVEVELVPFHQELEVNPLTIFSKFVKKSSFVLDANFLAFKSATHAIK
jgi:hypothetical protein